MGCIKSPTEEKNISLYLLELLSFAAQFAKGFDAVVVLKKKNLAFFHAQVCNDWTLLLRFTRSILQSSSAKTGDLEECTVRS